MAQESRQKIQQRIQEHEEELKVLQQEREAINVSADKAVEDSEETFTQLIRLLQERRREVKQEIRTQQESEVSRVRDVEEKLEQEITELKRKDPELELLSHTHRHTPSLSALGPSTRSSRVHTCPLTHFEAVTAAVAELRDQVQEALRDKRTSVSPAETRVEVLPPQAESRSRAEFLRRSQEITLDPDTANEYLYLSEGNRRATYRSRPHLVPRHPDRFTFYFQVLSRERLRPRCYFEVEKNQGQVYVAVAYRSIRRSGGADCLFGLNDKSWTLICDKHMTNQIYFEFNKKRTPLPCPQASRVGVDLDQGAGRLCFYSVSGDGTMTLLYRVHTSFTQPLYAGLGLGGSDGGNDTTACLE